MRFIWDFDGILTLFPKVSDTVGGFPSSFRDRADKPPPDVPHSPDCVPFLAQPVMEKL